nr:phage tail tape measure protein [Bacillus subtilis]
MRSSLTTCETRYLDLGATTSKSASEVAEAMTELATKGFDANQVIAAMPGIIKAAEASGEDLALTSDTVTSALNAFGMEYQRCYKGCGHFNGHSEQVVPQV